MAAVALNHGINANLLRRWVTEHERYGKPSLSDEGHGSPVAQTRDMSPANWLAISPPRSTASRQVSGAGTGQDNCRARRPHAGELHHCAGTGWLRHSSDAAMARPRCDGPGAVCSCRADMIHVEQIWLAVEPMDMRAGPDTALARVVKDFGAARPHHAYVFANKRANRLKILVHDGLGVWLAAHFSAMNMPLSDPLENLDADALRALLREREQQLAQKDRLIRHKDTTI